MICYSDDAAYARRIFPDAGPWTRLTASEVALTPGLKSLAAHLLGTPDPFLTQAEKAGGWQMFCTEFSAFSQYDCMIGLREEGRDLPDLVACLAGSGENFHGQRGRPWSAAAGNIHLTVHFRPERNIPDFGLGFPLLAAVSVIETLDSLPGLEGSASLKWVNDILLGRAKVAGFVAHVQTLEDKVRSAVLGLGLNVETVPRVEPDPFVPRVTSLKAQSPFPEACLLSTVLDLLLERLEVNYLNLCAGDTRSLLDVFRARSAVLGRKVRVISDPLEGPGREVACGRVTGIGDRLELYLDGRPEPLYSGRLILLD